VEIAIVIGKSVPQLNVIGLEYFAAIASLTRDEHS
jgi:hypothetical protein